MISNAGPRRVLSLEGWVWACQALSGAALLVLIGVHWAAQHLLAPGGLRDYSEVLSFVRQPGVWALETVFLTVSAVHAALGVRAILLDIGRLARLARWIDGALAFTTLAVIAYGIELLRSIIS